MNNYFICILLLMFFTSCLQSKKTNVDLINRMHQADSLSILSDNENLSDYTFRT